MGRVVRNKHFKREMGRPESSRPWQREVGRTTLPAIQGHTPVQFGTLRDTMFVRIHYDGTTTRIIFGSLRAYATWQEVGTGIYGPMKRYITPKHAQMLRWVDQVPGAPGGPGPVGNVRFARRVKGTPPKKYMFKGLRDTFGPNNSKSFAAQGGKNLPLPRGGG